MLLFEMALHAPCVWIEVHQKTRTQQWLSDLRLWRGHSPIGTPPRSCGDGGEEGPAVTGITWKGGEGVWPSYHEGTALPKLFWDSAVGCAAPVGGSSACNPRVAPQDTHGSVARAATCKRGAARANACVRARLGGGDHEA